MLAIAIISLIGAITSLIAYIINEEKFDANIFLTIVAIIAWWHIALPVSIILIVFGGIVILANFQD
jgi:hypothetical protein